MATRRDLPTVAGSGNSSSSPLHTAEILEKERKSSSPSSVTSSTTKNTLNKINNPPTNCFVEEQDHNRSTDEKECRRFDGDDDAAKDKGGRFRVTTLSTTIINHKRKTPPPVFIDFFLNDEIKSSTIAAAAHQQPPPPPHSHPEEEYSDDHITTQHGLGWGPYIPIKKTSTMPTKRNDEDPDDDLELRIGPPIQKRQRRVFPDGYWEIRKRLTKSDVSGASRLLIGRKYVEDHILVHLNRVRKAAAISSTGTNMFVLDVDTDTEHRLVLKPWPSSCCYALSKNWNCDFVMRRGLSENSEIGLRWDEHNSRLEFAVLNS